MQRKEQCGCCRQYETKKESVEEGGRYGNSVLISRTLERCVRSCPGRSAALLQRCAASGTHRSRAILCDMGPGSAEQRFTLRRVRDTSGLQPRLGDRIREGAIDDLGGI